MSSLQYGRKGPNYYLVDPDITDNHGLPIITGSLSWALQQLPASGGCVELAPGDYLTESTIYVLQDNVMIKGAGQSSRIVWNRTTDDSIMEISGERVTLESLQISEDKTMEDSNTAPILRLSAAHDTSIRNCMFYDISGHEGIIIDGSDYVSINDCHFRGPCSIVVGSINNSEYPSVVNCFFNHEGNSHRPQDACVRYEDGGEWGIISGNYMWLTNLYGSYSHGVHVDLPYVLVTNNTIQFNADGSGSSNYGAIGIDGAFCSCCRNTIMWDRSGNGIRIFNDGEYHLVNENTIFNCFEYGVWKDTSTMYGRVLYNLIADCGGEVRNNSGDDRTCGLN